MPGDEFPAISAAHENVGITPIADLNFAFLVLFRIGVEIMRNSDVVVNDDGSVDLYIGPAPVEGFEANTVITSPDEDYFLMFRFYGAEPRLWDREWVLGDPELVG